MLRKLLLKAMQLSPFMIMLVLGWQADSAMKYPGQIAAGTQCIEKHRNYWIHFRGDDLCVTLPEKNIWDNLWIDIYETGFLVVAAAFVTAVLAKRFK